MTKMEIIKAIKWSRELREDEIKSLMRETKQNLMIRLNSQLEYIKDYVK